MTNQSIPWPRGIVYTTIGIEKRKRHRLVRFPQAGSLSVTKYVGQKSHPEVGIAFFGSNVSERLRFSPEKTPG